MTRKKTWADDFASWITRIHIASQPFLWGSLDCCLLGADGVQAITGTDIAADFRGNYDSQASAFAMIARLTGGSTVAEAIAWCADKYGLPEWPKPLFARRGDLVAVRNDDNEIIAGIVSDNGKDVLCMASEGVLNLPITQVVRAWKV